MNAAKNEVFIGLKHENCNLLGDEPLVGGFCDFGLHTLTLHYVKNSISVITDIYTLGIRSK